MPCIHILAKKGNLFRAASDQSAGFIRDLSGRARKFCASGVRVLVIDDICDSSKTMQHIKQKIGDTRYKSVRYVTLFAREKTKHVVDHYGVTVKEGTWLVFPWEK